MNKGYTYKTGSYHANVAMRCLLWLRRGPGVGGWLVSAALRARGTLRGFAGVSWLKVSFSVKGSSYSFVIADWLETEHTGASAGLALGRNTQFG